MNDASPSTMRDRALEELVRDVEGDIIFGRLAPGARLVEDALMARHGASRHYIRQALSQLERARLVRREKNVGATVVSFSAEEARQIYQVREMLTRQAALMIPLPVNPALIDSLREIQDRYMRADAGDLRLLHEVNDEFHVTLFSACGNPFLVRTLRDYMALTLPVRAKNLADPAGLSQSRAEHDIMIELLKGTESWVLAQICVDHLQTSKADYLGRIGSGGKARGTD
jgi:DNA-binding GntR family transcriptional regulator